MVPVLKTWKELGINMDELPESTRASMEGQVTDKTFADWLKRKTETDPTFADRTLGKGRAELFRDGKITMDQMISGGKPLTLSELKGKYVPNIKDANSLPITYHGKVSKNFKSEVNSAISGIPDNVLIALNNGGSKITACLKITDAYPELKGVKPRGWPDGSTWDDCPGFAKGRDITVAQTNRISTGKFVETNRTGGIIRHEAGHAFDAVLSDISSSSDYLVAYNKYIAILKTTEDYLDYDYLTQEGVAGRQETFAEVFAQLCGGHAGGSAIDPVTAFPNTTEIIKKIISGA